MCFDVFSNLVFVGFVENPSVLQFFLVLNVDVSSRILLKVTEKTQFRPPLQQFRPIFHRSLRRNFVASYLCTQLTQAFVQALLALTTPQPCIDIRHDTYGIDISMDCARSNRLGYGLLNVIPDPVTLSRTCLSH